MKNLMITALILFLGTTMPGKAANGDEKPTGNATSIKENASPIVIKVDVEFGRKKKGCLGFGICKIIVSTEADVPVAKYVNTDGGTITLDIPVSYIRATQPDKLKNFTGQSQFIVEEDFVIPAEVSAKLGAEGTLTVKAGKYSLSLHDNVYTLVISDML